MERSYITNMRRLLKLPEWAKEMIDAGTLTASHGKHILAADGHDQVLADIHTHIEQEITSHGQVPTTAEVAEIVEGTFSEHYVDITVDWADWRNAGTKFDIKSCADCKNCKRIKSRYKWQDDSIYCFDEACWQKKQDAAFEAERQKEKKAAAKAAQKATAQGEEPPQSKAQEANERGRIERTQLYLDEWLRGRLRTHLVCDEATCYKILLWMGAGKPEQSEGQSEYGWTYRDTIDPPSFRDIEFSGGIEAVLNGTLKPLDVLDRIVNAALDGMSRNNLRRLAHYCKITLDDYQIDDAYLSIKIKKELIEATPEPVRDLFDDWDKACKLPLGELRDGILTRGHNFGIPADLVEYYSEDS